jgi:putative peptidoglycan lipid II flippase
VGLWAFAGVRIIVAAFYSLKDTTTPAATAAVAVVANVLFSLLLMRPLEHAGLALATALASMLNGVVLVLVLNRRLGGIAWSTVLRSVGRSLLATVPVAAACLWIASLAVWHRPEAWLAKTVMLAVGIGLSVSGYLAIQALFRSPELDVLWDLVKRKVKRT